ncbi:hypothetical protein IWX90DRAFT_481424 [Phyllosticta citrichinensis]|uniref:Uncharacterized protein n=1 Tax=Phyllosticta citrichinensis TaxID=1130410 RepID=A0ABR1XGV2_9PEZI
MKPQVFRSLLLLSGSGLASTGSANHADRHEHPGPQAKPLSSSFLNFSSPAPYIFSSLSGLLSEWSNTFFPQDHAITACVIPAHTQLYHGRHDAYPPPSPEWLAFDVEMSYGIMGNLKDSRMLTYRTTRPVKALYFDGDLVARRHLQDAVRRRGGPRRPPGGGPPDYGGGKPLDDEYWRAEGLCSWMKEHGLGGKGWGYEGVVRMNAGFEMIWCDFDSPSLKLVSNLNVSAPRIDMKNEERWPGRPVSDDEAISKKHGAEQIALLGHGGQTNAQEGEKEGRHGPDMTDYSEPFRYASLWMWFTAGVRHYGRTAVGPGRGEARVRVDTYPELQSQATSRVKSDRKSLNISLSGHWQASEDEKERATALEELMRRTRFHRISNVSKQDGALMRTSVEQRLRAVLGNETTSCSGIDWRLTAQEVVTFYTWNLENLLRLLKSFSLESDRAQAALKRCRTQYSTQSSQLNEGEQLLSRSVKETLDGLCQTVFKVGLGIEYEWLWHLNKAPEDMDSYPSLDHSMLAKKSLWRRDVEELMAWLGWVEQWTTCKEPCASDELCYVPMWPVNIMMRDDRDRRRKEADDPSGGQLYRADAFDDNNEADNKPSGGSFGRFGEEHLWRPICVNASAFPP